MSEPAIYCRRLAKDFGQRNVLDSIDLEVRAGEVFGYLGPKGAGKSTTVRILTGLLGDFQGEVRVAGIDVRADPTEVKRRIGYVPENAELYGALNVQETLELVGRLHELDEELIRERSMALTTAFGIETRLRSRVTNLSKGMRQKLMFCVALLHDPQVLLLDEPLSGLDVAATVLVKELLRALADRGAQRAHRARPLTGASRIFNYSRSFALGPRKRE